MMIAVVTVWTSEYAPLAELVIPNRKEYCDRHGYDFIGEQVDDRPCQGYWLPYFTLVDVLPSYDIVAVLDVDLLIMNQRKEIALPQSVRFASGSDVHGFNSGVTLWRRTSADLLCRVLTGQRFYDDYPNPDQSAMAHLLIGQPGVAVWPQRECNSYLYGEYGIEYSVGEFRPFDFILHFPGLSMDRRVQLIEEYLPQVVR